MSNGYEYLRAVTVASVGGGGVTDENGRFLRSIGNLPVKAGDRVWTDGRIVYGHVPVRQNVNLAQNKPGVPIFGLPWAGYVLPDGRVRKDKGGKISTLVNWGYTDKRKIYGNDNFKGIGSEHGFYLDVFCEGNDVYTAEYEDDVSAVPNGIEIVRRDKNPMMYCAWNAFSKFADNGWNDFYFEGYSKNCGNAKIVIKKNGSIIANLPLSDYKFARDRLKAVFEKYLVVYPEEDKFEIGVEGMIEPLYTIYAEILCPFEITQVLHFHFCAGGGWEMILLCQTAGGFLKGGRKRGSAGNIWRDNFFEDFVVYVVRVNSNGNKQILQEWLSPVYEYWYEVNRMEEERKRMPPFSIDFDGCSLTTDLISCSVSVGQNVMIDNYILRGFKYLWTASYYPWHSYEDPFFTITFYSRFDTFRRTNIRTGEHEIYKLDAKVDVVPEIRPMLAAGDEYGVIDDYAGKKTFPTKTGMGGSYFGRLSAYKLAEKTYIVTLFYNFAVLIKDGEVVKLTDCTFNTNIEKLKSRGRQAGTITDLIADMTARELSGSQGG